MIMIIINFTGIIGYRLYLFSSTGPTCLSIPLPPSSPSQPSIFASTPQDRGERIERERKRERERERERDGYIYKLTKQRYAILKCRGRGRGWIKSRGCVESANKKLFRLVQSSRPIRD